MNKLRLIVLLTTILGAGAHAQTRWEEAGEIEDARVIIEKDRKIELPKASRNYERVPPLPVSETDEELNYEFSSIELEVPAIEPRIRVFTIKEEPLDKFYNNYLRLGAGNYLTPYAELFSNTKRSDLYSAGFHFKHLSSIYGPVDRRNSGTSETSFSGNGKYFTEPLVFSGEAKFHRNKYYFYGYQPQSEVDRDTLRQVFNGMEVSLGMEDNFEESDVSFNFNTGFGLLSDRFNASEWRFGADFTLDYILSDELLATVETDMTLSQIKDAAGELNRNIFRVKPSFTYVIDPLTIQGGFNVVAEKDSVANEGMRFYPFARASYDLLENIQLYGGIGGDIEENYLYDLAAENPYLAPNVHIIHTNKTFGLYGGVRGSWMKDLTFDAGFSLANFRNMHFFVNAPDDTTQFDILYDRGVKRLNFFASAGYSRSDIFRASFRWDYYGYDVNNLREAWHKPKNKLTLSARYNLYNKIVLNGDLFVVGGIKALGPATGETVELPAAADLNMSLEYLFSNRFSAFLSFNNILSDNYQLYLNYPTRGLLVMGGISYRF